MATDDPLLGREPELAAIDGALAAAAAGRGQLLLVVGEPGIGKTRLADAFEDRAHARGFSVHWGRVSETGGAPAYWPWTQALGDIAAEPGLEAAAGSGAPLAPILAGGTAAPAGDAAQARFRLLEGVTALLRAAGKKAPRAIVLDDVHAADPSSLELLQFVSRSLRGLHVALLVTYRDVEARQSPEARDVLSRAARDGTVLALRRLDAGEVATLVARRLAEAPANVVTAVQRVTEGNPLFVGEVVRQLAADPASLRTLDLDRLPVTEGIRLVIADRIALLPTEARATLDAASVLGREARLDVVAGMTGLPVAEANARLRALVAADLVDEREGGRFVFQHVLFREVPYRELSPGRRAALHLAAAEALGACSGPRRLAEVAHHMLEAREAADTARVVGAALQAAQGAIAVLAYTEAVRFLDRGEAVLADRPGHEGLRGALLAVRAEAMALLGDVPASQKAARTAAEIARAIGDTDLLCQAALATARVFEPGVVDPGRIELLREALAAVGADDSAVHARLLARLAAALQPAVVPEEPIAMALEAVAMARRVGDPDALLAVLRAAASAMADSADPAERLVVDSELAELARVRQDPVLELQARQLLFLDHHESGDVALARLRLAEIGRLAAALGEPRYRWRLPLLEASLCIEEGRFEEAIALEEEAERIGEGGEHLGLALGLQRSQLHALRGRLDDATRSLSTAYVSLGSVLDASAIAALRLAQLEARCGDPKVLEANIARLPQFAFDSGDPLMVILLCEILAVGRDPRVAEQVGKAEAYRHRLLNWGLIGSFMDVPGGALQGLGEVAAGRHREGIALLSEAAEMVTAMKARALEAWVRLWLGEALAVAGQPARAAPELERAQALAAQLGIEHVPERARRALTAPTAPAVPISAEPTPAPVPAALAFELKRSGDAWLLRRSGSEVHLKDLRGLQILARLLAEPGREIHCTELAASESGPADLGDSGELLDREAKEAYRRRLQDLRDELEEAEGHNDAGRAERIRVEMDALTRELARAVGLGGRDRRAGAAAERARTAVQRRVREAVRRIAEHDPELGRHLEWAVHTGAFCSYDPEGRA